MSWMLSICVAAALLALCRGQNTEHEGNSLSASGYRLCTYNETRNVSLLVMHAAPYTVTKPCGGWLHWKTCTVTLYRMTHETETRTVKQQVTRCCPGHVQVGRYCALPVNRSDEFTAKPGSCPTADGVQNRSGGCEWDIDCPGWHKCCQSSSRYVCSDPANSTYYSDNGGYRFNATVTVKTDYQPLMSTDRGLLDHTRLLQAMVTGALQSDVTVYYLSSQPVHPFRTATSILIACNLTLSLHTVTSELHLLLKHIQEVSSVTVEDVDECALSALRGCSPHSDCNNTVGSYLCSCHQGYVDVDPSNPGAHCTAGVSVETTPEPCLASVPPMNTTTVSASSSTQERVRNITEGSFSSTGTSMPTAQSNTSTVAYNSSNAPQWTSSYSSLRSTVEPPLPTTTCYPANITSVWAADVTGTSFRVHWSSQFQTNQTYQVDLSKRSEVIHSGVTSQTMMEMRDLQPGVLYTVAVTPSSCQQGITVDISVKTDAQKLEATTRLTNIEFSADLQNGSSQAYQNLTESITQEIYQSLSPEMKAMVDSGPDENRDHKLFPGECSSLLNSTKYTVDKNNTSTHDFNECTMGENDCSLLATCTNTWASYTCVCLDGFIDNNPERPGRACHAITTTPTSTTTTATAPPTTINPPTPSIAALITTIAPTITTTAPTTTTSTLPTTITAPTTTPIAPTTTTAAPPTTTTAPTATITTPTTTIPTTTAPTTITAPTPAITALTTTTTANIYTTAAPTATITTPTITTVAPATTITAPTTTTTANITTTAAHTTTITAAAITNTAPISTMSSSATTTTAATTITITTPTTAPVITPSATAIPTTAPTTASTTTLTAATTTPNALTTIMTAPVITTSAMISMTSTPSTSVTNPTSTITAPPSTATTLRTAPSASTLGEISVQCRVASITVTVSRAFLLSNNIRESSLYLGLPECGVNGGNALHAQLTVAWDECGTSLVHNETYYMASVPLFNTMDMYTSDSGTVEAPKIQLEVPIMCSYMKSMLISADFGSMGYDMIKDLTITGSGEFQVTVQLMNGTMPLPHNYSLSSEEAVVSSTNAGPPPTLHPVDISSHIFLENSCSMNAYTTVLMNGNSSTSRVSAQIFSFIDLDVIYLHCQVQICVQTGSGSCVPDCQQRTAQSSNTIGTAFGSSGPLLRSNEEFMEEESDTLHLVGLSCLGIGVSLFFIMGFVCLFYYQRNRIGHYNFSAKPKQENFTYLVFNT
ncbi:hypothetical protein CgunFtcFv8_003437 [Champsocephalus gunnari]|uniref:Uromodulin-like 1 n=1 Tax=Champsocephalus gunnari TaxID=52237 RepID=A0AAN8HKH0_CHAGU|nr:hypothetical protein CgunFtcFv8_003437 [Champsocephalus gunnari]